MNPRKLAILYFWALRQKHPNDYADVLVWLQMLIEKDRQRRRRVNFEVVP
jgi:hypothetical protein